MLNLEKQGGTLCSVLPCRSVVVQAESKVKQLSSLLGLFACSIELVVFTDDES